ncbi:MAG: hypothetical protein LBF27_31520 [Sphingobacterium sp.]|jgi:hypothetical protein|nr:hypothetical protein [Sphingobacterium sp.]
MKKCNTLNQYLGDIKYINIPNVNSVADCLFVKKMTNGLFLFLGVIFSKYEKGKFTGNFYLSKVTIFSAVWDDIPPNSYKRVSTFLKEEERLLFLSKDYCKQGMVDGWWNIGDNDSIMNFKSTVDLVETRFLNQDKLFESIQNSVELRNLDELSENVIIEIISSKGNVDKLLDVKKNKINNEWFEVAKSVLSVAGGNLTEPLIKRLASDAWRKTFIRKSI